MSMAHDYYGAHTLPERGSDYMPRYTEGDLHRRELETLQRCVEALAGRKDCHTATCILNTYFMMAEQEYSAWRAGI